MLISIDWIKDFVDLNGIEPRTLSTKFTLGTAEVEGIEIIGEFFKKIVVAKITHIEKHPEADKLNLVTFSIGDEEKRVVCGAENVSVGLKVPFAPIGTTLPVGFTLEPKKIRGILSEGMLCSEEELGYAESSSGLMELAKDAPLGQTLLEYFDEDEDVIIDVDNKSLTHRPDLWGHFGLAREFAAVFEKPLKNPYDSKWSKDLESKIGNGTSPIIPKLVGESSCLGYMGLSVDNIKVEDSPKWLKKRLKAVGLRPINNIVDISNYVMTELGHPLHIFDRDLIEDNTIEIKALTENETFTTLDEIERTLVPSDTVICDSKKTLVLAGIMGGLNSGVQDNTSKVFIEVANWVAPGVRRTSTRLGLRTDSSQRYEKTLDSQLMKKTMLRTLELILKLCPDAKVIGKLEYDGQNLDNFKNLEIETSFLKINSVLGIDLPNERILSIFNALDFSVTEKGEKLSVVVPSYRSTKDIEVEADLIEEIGRIVGYDNIKAKSPLFPVRPVSLTAAQKLHRNIRDFMSLNGKSFEILTYPLIGDSVYKKSMYPQDTLDLFNFVSKDHSKMRSSMIPTLLEACAKNVKHESEFRLFELGRVYLPAKNNFCDERSQVAIAFYDKDRPCFVKLIETVERLMTSLDFPYQLSNKNPKFKNDVLDEAWAGVHPHEFINIRLMGKMHGVINSVHPLVLRNLKIKGHLSIAVIDLTNVEKSTMKDKTKYVPISNQPKSTFDCTVVASKESTAQQVLSSFNKLKIKELVDVKIVDIYELSETENTVTLRSTFFDPEKTLSNEFISSAKNKICEQLENNGFPLKTM